jgi:aspartate/methionine/tyrosine aminotransferase
VLGLPELRAEIAAQWSAAYGGADRARAGRHHPGLQPGLHRRHGHAGRAGDEVILPTPWYFNHKMWLDMAGVKAVPLPTGDGLIPDPDRAPR